ncbi:class I adenylate cyclase [Methylothermus subterraneus]
MAPQSHPPIHLAAPGGEISRKDLRALVCRFLQLHRQRLLHLSAWLTPRQRDCLEILPLLLHCNHPALPGYRSGQAPAGINAYSVSRTAHKAAQRLAPGFAYRRKAVLAPPIRGLFLMGSAGSIAYSYHSDLDVWVCHRSDLKEEERAELRAKCEDIASWAGTEGLKVHFFLVDPEGFRQGRLEPLSAESSGTTQHGLLLEEFYRTAVHLAGGKLLWWLVPPEQENRYRGYADYLLARRFVDPDSVIDLGGLERVPAEEFVSAGLWHLYKALSSPYKELLKLELLLDYAAAYPQPNWLAAWIKAEVYAGRLEAERLDPYLCLYRRIEQSALARGRGELLPLLRRSFGNKIAPALNHPEHRSKWKALLSALGLENFASSAGARLERIEQADEEWQILVKALEQDYQRLRRFVFQHGLAEPAGEDLLLLGRKLQATLERRPNKVDVVRLVPEGGLPELALSVRRERALDGRWYWRLERGDDADAGRPLYQASHLVQVIAWAQVNGIDRPGTQWTLHPGSLPLTTSELRFLNQNVRRLLEKRSKAPLSAYRQPPRLQAAALFLNLAAPTRPQRGGFSIASERFDPLSYGAERRALVQHVELLSINSWEEIQVDRYHGLEGLLDCLCRLYEQGGAEMALAAHCFSSPALALRVLDLYQNLSQVLRANPASWFVLRGGVCLYVFCLREGRLIWWPCEDEAALEESLGSARADFTPVVFDPQAMQDSPLPFLYRHNRPGKVQLFLRPYANGTEVFVLDERGALYRQNCPGAPPQIVLQRYAVLLEALARRYPAGGAVEYAWLEAKPKSWQMKAAHPPQPQEPAIQVRVYAEELAGGPPRFTLVCNERVFSSLELGERVFAEAARYIRKLRQSGEQYPCYVSDLNVPARVLGLTHPDLLHTACLLAYKRKVEQRLNQ